MGTVISLCVTNVVVFLLFVLEFTRSHILRRKLKIVKAGISLSSRVLSDIKEQYPDIDVESFVFAATRQMKEEVSGKRD